MWQLLNSMEKMQVWSIPNEWISPLKYVLECVYAGMQKVGHGCQNNPKVEQTFKKFSVANPIKINRA